MLLICCSLVHFRGLFARYDFLLSKDESHFNLNYFLSGNSSCLPELPWALNYFHFLCSFLSISQTFSSNNSRCEMHFSSSQVKLSLPSSTTSVPISSPPYPKLNENEVERDLLAVRIRIPSRLSLSLCNTISPSHNHFAFACSWTCKLSLDCMTIPSSNFLVLFHPQP